MPTVEYHYNIQKTDIVTEDDLDKCEKTFGFKHPNAQEITMRIIES